jgi:hypothetical protein
LLTHSGTRAEAAAIGALVPTKAIRGMLPWPKKLLTRIEAGKKKTRKMISGGTATGVGSFLSRADRTFPLPLTPWSALKSPGVPRGFSFRDFPGRLGRRGFNPYARGGYDWIAGCSVLLWGTSRAPSNSA